MTVFMKIKFLPFILLIGMLFIIISCDWIDIPTSSEYEEKIVINGMLFADQKLTEVNSDFGDDYLNLSFIKLNRTADITEVYSSDTTAISDGFVTLEDLTIDSLYTLTESDSLPGVYFHQHLEFEEGHSYRLTVIDTLTNGIIDTVFAETTIPSALVIEETIVDDEPIGDLMYADIHYKPAIQGEADMFNPIQFTLKITPEKPGNPPAMGRIQNIAIDERLDEYLEYFEDDQNPPPGLENDIRDSLMITEDDTLLAFLWKWYHLPEDSLMQRITYRRTSQYSFSQLEDDLMVGWTFFTFYGLQFLGIYSLDENYYNYHKGNLEGPPSDPHYLPESNVVGGYGLFASGNLGDITLGFPENAKIYNLLKPE